MDSFLQRLAIFRESNAEAYAADLFKECFGAPFPVPRRDAGLAIETPPEDWRQFVAVYTWEDGKRETVGFCNWIRYADAYLEGGLCVRPTFYRRLPRARFLECKAAGGIAQLLMERAAGELNDCKAWFGYCGDAKSLAVTLRTGYQLTDHKYLIVRWFGETSEEDRRNLIAAIQRIGPF